MIPGFEKGVLGMSVGEIGYSHGTRDAYGHWDERGVQYFNR